MCRINSDSKAVQNQSPIPNEPAAPVDCCGGLNNVDYSKVLREDTCIKTSVHVEFARKSVYLHRKQLFDRLNLAALFLLCQKENIRCCLFSE